MIPTMTVCSQYWASLIVGGSLPLTWIKGIAYANLTRH